jgi:hypothetical protein
LKGSERDLPMPHGDSNDGTWRSWFYLEDSAAEAVQDIPRVRKRRPSEMVEEYIPRVRKRRRLEMPNDKDATTKVNDEPRPSRRQKRVATVEHNPSVSTQKKRDSGLVGIYHANDEARNEFPRRSARLKSMNSSPCCYSKSRKTLCSGMRTGLVSPDHTTGEVQNGSRPRRSARLKSIHKSPHCGSLRPSRTRPNGRRRTNITLLPEAG